MIYLDYNASTPLAAEVIESMQTFLQKHFGNPSSGHWAGRPARDAIDRARRQVAALLGCEPDEVVFTSGGTEANNFALKGLMFGVSPPGHVIISAVEHPAIVEPCRFLQRMGTPVTTVGVNATGMVDPDDVRRAITPKTRLISIMHANNEVGTIEPIREIADIAAEHDVPTHTDAAQSVGKIPTRIADLGVDLLSVAGHKLYGPKGVGVLVIRRGLKLEPFMHGAGHENGRRAGTENTLGIVGLGAACELAAGRLHDSELQRLRDRFWERLQEEFGDRVVLNGHSTLRLPNTLNVSFPGKIGAEILASLDDVAASTGSACHSGSIRLSPVLEAMGTPVEVGMGAIRFSLGHSTNEEEIQTVVARLKNSIG